MPKKGDRVAPPPVAGEFDIRFLDTAAVRGWEALGASHPTTLRRCWEAMRLSPMVSVAAGRHHPLRDDLAARAVGGRLLPQWQFEVGGSERVWYCVDESKRTVWVSYAGGHPKATE
jgi:hypothetical protein